MPSISRSMTVGARHGEFVAFAPHRLDQHGQVQLAASGNPELVRIAGLLYPQGDVVLEFLVQPRLDLPAGQVFALAAGERRLVDEEHHADRRLIDLQRRQRLDSVAIAHRVGNLQVVDTAEHDDIARSCLVDVDAIEPAEAIQLHELCIAHRAVAPDDADA